MLKFSSKKAYTLIEVICALSILSILLLASITTELYYFSAKKYNRTMIDSTLYLEALRNNFTDKYSYADIDRLQNNRNYYVSKENMKLESLKEPGFICNLKELPVLEGDQIEKPYVVIRKENGDGRCLNIKLTAYIQNHNCTESLQVEFLKGDY